MTKVPDLVSEFLRGKRFAVAGVSRNSGQAAKAVYRKLRDSGYEALPLNPNAAEMLLDEGIFRHSMVSERWRKVWQRDE